MKKVTNCCRICSKMFCPNRNEIENCKDCVSFVWLELKKLNEKVTIENK